MRRSRTPTTAWPAVADLMTILAVIGLSAAAAVVGSGSRGSRAELEQMLLQREAAIRILQDSIARIIDPFVPCWRGRSGGRRYHFSYDVTYANGHYSLSRHDNFETGIEAAPDLPSNAERALREVPGGAVDEAGLVAFGRSLTEAFRGRYAANCKLAVTINPEATGREVSAVVRAGFFPVYRGSR